MMHKKKLFAGLGLLSVFVVFFLVSNEKKQSNTDYIFDKSTPITLEAAIKSRTPIPNLKKSLSTKSVDEHLEEKTFSLDADEDTLRYFHHLHTLYKKSPDMVSHLQKIKTYLFSTLPEDEAGKTFELYEKYLKCEIALAQEIQNLPMAKDPESAIDLLKTTQEFRREQLGVELADALYGAEVKNREYAMRRALVVHNKELYGLEKERMLSDLNEDMWNEDADLIDGVVNPYNRYQEKIKIYELDLSEMSSDADRLDKIKEFRKDFFPEKVVSLLDEVDQKIENEKDNEQEYYLEEEKIRNNTSLNNEEKEGEIKSLQDEFFGDQSDAFRRSEAMRAGLEKLKNETEQNRS